MTINTETKPHANPLPFGLVCMAVAVFMFSGYLWGALQGSTIAPYVLFVGGFGMLLGAAASYRRGDTFDATWLAVCGVFWAATAFYFWFFYAASLNPTADLGWAAVAWGAFVGYIFIVSLRVGSPIISLMLGLFFVLLACAWVANAFNFVGLDKSAAIVGILTAIVGAAESFWLAWDAAPSTAHLADRIGSQHATPQRTH